jgi:uncharacterized protein YukE
MTSLRRVTMADSSGAKPDTGFTVNLTALSGVAGQVGQAADGLQKTITQYHSVESTPADFGNPALASVFASFDDGWASVLSVTSQATSELAAAVQAAGKTYSSAEVANTRAAGQLGNET